MKNCIKLYNVPVIKNKAKILYIRQGKASLFV